MLAGFMVQFPHGYTGKTMNNLFATAALSETCSLISALRLRAMFSSKTGMRSVSKDQTWVVSAAGSVTGRVLTGRQ